jgi:beta-lactam-binding protein with PASTA domain
MSLSTVERRIRAAHCRVGKISHSSSERYRHGAVIELSHRPGTKLSSNAALGVLVSSGRPRHRKR